MINTFVFLDVGKSQGNIAEYWKGQGKVGEFVERKSGNLIPLLLPMNKSSFEAFIK